VAVATAASFSGEGNNQKPSAQAAKPSTSSFNELSKQPAFHHNYLFSVALPQVFYESKLIV
jgi:hypothetical protein